MIVWGGTEQAGDVVVQGIHMWNESKMYLTDRETYSSYQCKISCSGIFTSINLASFGSSAIRLA